MNENKAEYVHIKDLLPTGCFTATVHERFSTELVSELVKEHIEEAGLTAYPASEDTLFINDQTTYDYMAGVTGEVCADDEYASLDELENPHLTALDVSRTLADAIIKSASLNSNNTIDLGSPEASTSANILRVFVPFNSWQSE